MIEATLSPNALYDDSGPAIKVYPNGRIQVLVDDLKLVRVPHKLLRYLEEPIKALKPAEKGIVMDCSLFEAFTPSMLTEVTNRPGVGLEAVLAALEEEEILERCPVIPM